MLTLPKRASLKDGLCFAQSREQWLLSQITRQGARIRFLDGALIPVFGNPHLIKKIDAQRGLARMEGGVIYVPGDKAGFERRIREVLKTALLHEVSYLTKEKSQRIGRHVRSITLKDTTSRWGSCSPGGDITFSWRMVFAPYAVLDYLVAHEVAHLQEMNHSEHFWTIVALLCPEYKRQRNWLKREGERLYRYG